MRLKRLELQGFKSFVDRTILSFEPGITGVVGPNGCGKSNIVDAILWVMGEQSAKHLRGESMSDVIFNGSESRAPTSMAEVSLVLDGQGVTLAPHLLPLVKGDEISVTRRLFRDGTAEYLINKMPVRLKDVHEIFMDTGVGRRAYSIIEQGQIDRMINVKPEDRRFIFEEVAGITKYKTKRKEAERKLEQTRLNLSRLDDILNELDKQIRSLKIQATRARKFKEIKGELEHVDLFLLGRKLFDLKRAMDEIAEERDRLVNERAELDARVAALDARVTDLDVQRIDQEKALEQMETRERDLALGIQRLESQLALSVQQRGHITQGIEARAQEGQEIEQQLSSLSEDVGRLGRERDDISGQVTELGETIRGVEERAAKLQETKRGLDRQRDGLRNTLSQLAQKAVHLQGQQAHGKAKEEQHVARCTELNQQLTDVIVTLDGQKKRIEELEARVASCTARAQEVESRAASIHSECQRISSRLSTLEESLFEAREAFHARKSRLDSLKELQESLEGYSPTAREILLKMEGDAPAAVPLAEVLYPEPEVEETLEILLGEALNTLLVRTPDEARRLASLIQARGLEKVGILAVEELPSVLPEGEAPATSLLSKVEARAGYESVAKWWLQKVYLCDTIDEVFTRREEDRQGTFITRDNRVIAHRSGLFMCGVPTTKQGIFARRREIEQLTTECEGLEAQVTALGREREELLGRLESQEKLHAELKDNLSSLHIEGVGHRKEREQAQRERDRADRDYGRLTEESEANSRALDAVRAKLEQWTKEIDDINGQRAAAEEELARSEEGMREAEASVQQAMAELSGLKVDRTKLEERLVSVEEKLESVESDTKRLEARRASLDARRIEDLKRLESMAEAEKALETQREEAASERATLVGKITDLRDAFEATSRSLTELRAEKDDLQDGREETVDKLQNAEVRLTQAQANYDHQKSIGLERYQREAEPLGVDAALSLESIPLFASQAPENWDAMTREEREALLAEHLDALKKKVERYGEVNLTAIHEYDEVQKRHDFLLEQKQDLEKSVQILEQAIKRIDETTKQRFLETFEGVNEKFREVFPILFNGGKAELALTNPDSILESGVDIMVQPPGKRLQSISLLSGGEKALTAVSLILAIFARKPSPFCLLDEVDAPLDDANVSRFNTVIKRMALKSQFIVVTHNRKTMDIADALFGVTMEKPGISKMTSVRLN